MKILCLGDVVGPVATEKLCRSLWKIRKERGISFVMVNAENADAGNGLTPATARELLASGADVLTSGNHIWKKREIYNFLDDSDRLLRPANYPDENPGTGYTILDCDGWRLLVINVQGTVFMESLDCPFRTVEKILARCEGRYDLSLMDIHAEATSEKIALAHYFDGKINMIVGTHTHVPTADARILPGGSGYVTDLGMCGVTESALGVKAECIIKKLKYKTPVKFELETGKVTLQGVEIDINMHYITANSVTRLELEEF